MDIELFDVKAWLNDRGIRAYTSGKNCSPGWINIRCPFCSDRSNHLGINLTSKKFKCWKCHRKGLITNVISTLDGVGFDTARKTLEEFVLPHGTHIPVKRVYDTKYSYPPGALDNLPTIHRNYLIDRGFNPDEIQEQYKVKACWESGKYKFRLIIPVIMNHKIAGFTARDVTNLSYLRYKQQPKEEAPVWPSHWVYNIDTVTDVAVVVEGPFDVWRMGPQFVSFMGVEATMAQAQAILKKGVKRAIIVYDPEEEAQEIAHQFAYMLGMFIETERVELDLPEGKDPADLTPQEAAYLRNQIL